MKCWMVATMAALTVVAVGCSSNSSESGSKGGAGNSKEPFRIASPVDKTGADAAVGSFWSAGLDAAVKAINASGGILGRQVVVDYKDTQSNPQVATQISDQMLSTGKYQALIPTAGGASTEPIMQVVNRHKILAIGTGSILDMSDPKKYPTAFDVKYDASAQGAAVACLAASYHPTKVAYLHIDDPFPAAQNAAMKPIWDRLGVKVVADESYPFTATDVTPQVQKIMQAKPDVLILQAYFNSLSAAIKAINALNYDVQIVGDSETSAAPPSSFLAAGEKVPKNLVAMQWAINARVNGQLSQQQQTAAQAVSGEIGGKFSAVLATYLYDYDALELVKWAAEKANSEKTADMVKALEGLNGNSTDTHTFITNPPPFSSTFHGNRGGMYAVDITGQYVDGTFPATKPIPSC